MIEISYNVQIQMINTKGLLAISYALEKVKPLTLKKKTFKIKLQIKFYF